MFLKNSLIKPKEFVSFDKLSISEIFKKFVFTKIQSQFFKFII